MPAPLDRGAYLPDNTLLWLHSLWRDDDCTTRKQHVVEYSDTSAVRGGGEYVQVRAEDGVLRSLFGFGWVVASSLHLGAARTVSFSADLFRSPRPVQLKGPPTMTHS